MLLALITGDSELALLSLPRQEGCSLRGTLWSEVADSVQQLHERPAGASGGRAPGRQAPWKAGEGKRQVSQDGKRALVRALVRHFPGSVQGADRSMQWVGESPLVRPGVTTGLNDYYEVEAAACGCVCVCVRGAVLGGR